MKLVVSDSGPLIIFGRSEKLDLLRQVAGEIIISATVYKECTRDAQKPGALLLLQAAQSGLITIHENVSTDVLHVNAMQLDDGERSAIALALHLGCPILMDERLGRNIAELHHLTLIGSAGVLLAAKQRGLIAQVTPTLDAWQELGYFLSPKLKKRVLQLAGEH